jgi:uncharacterized Zn finger protein
VWDNPQGRLNREMETIMFECPECTSAMFREMIGDGPDTYFYVYTCPECGTELEVFPKRPDLEIDDDC